MGVSVSFREMKSFNVGNASWITERNEESDEED